MAGQYGSKQTTNRNLKLVRDEDNNLLLVKEVSLPGGYVVVNETNHVG